MSKQWSLLLTESNVAQKAGTSKNACEDFGTRVTKLIIKVLMAQSLGCGIFTFFSLLVTFALHEPNMIILAIVEHLQQVISEWLDL